MPLAPQITNTPIPDSTWYVSTDFQTDAGGIATVQTTTTFYANPTPTASAIGDIWFDLSNGNKQHRWDGSTWAIVQDTAIATANTNASNAVTSANGKNKVTYSSSSPSSYSNIQTGDTWFIVSGSNITGVYKWNGGSWDSQALSHQTISSVDVGALLAGTITVALGITNPSGNFTVDATTGALTCTGASVTGTINAANGSVGGWSLSSSKISANSGLTYLDSSTGNIVTIGSITSGGGFSSSSGNITTGGTVGGANVSAVSQVSSATILTSGLATLYSLTVENTAGIYGGYGVNTSWSPNTDNTWNLGISGSYRWSHVYANNTTITTSDARLKTNVVTSPLGLNFINSLRPVAYQWIEGGRQIVLDDKGEPVVTGTDSNGKPIFQTTSIAGKRTHYGLIAQEVKTALDAANVGDFAGWVQDDLTKPDSTQSISYEQFIAPLIKAVQELTARVAALESK